MPAKFAPSAPPAVIDLKSCEAWLARATLADARQACRELTALLESIEESPPPGDALVEILERLREPIFVALAEHAKRFAARPLPLTDFEISAFDQACDLWAVLGRLYRRLLRALIEARPGKLGARGALLAQRSIDCVGELMLAHYRARREIAPELWQNLHQLYEIAEREEVALTTVSAGYKSKSVSTATEVYTRALLLALANPYTLSARELAWTRRWATMWAYKVDLSPTTEDAQGYAVDLRGNTPPAWVTAERTATHLRYLETSSLRRSVRGRLRKLEAGAEPQSLGLGKDCVQPDVARLLVQLSRAWVEAPAPRQFTRRLAGERTELVSGLEAIHAAVSGRAFKSAVRHWDYSRREAEHIHITGKVAASAGDAAPSIATEKWETLDESATGFRLRRKAAGERLSLAQLIALRPETARSFILSDVRWLMAGIDGTLMIGAAALPGLAKGVAVRPATTPNNAPEPYTQAFVLPNSTAQAASLVLPAGWFQAGREIELRDEDDSLTRVKLIGLFQRGYDYDRASFAVIGSIAH